MSAVSSADHSSFDSDFARAISRRFEHGRFLNVGANARKLQCQFAEANREAEVWSHGELASKLSQDTGKERFQTAVWQEIMEQRWGGVLHGDPYYNPNLSRERADFSLGK
jgi:hypothetical protein